MAGCRLWGRTESDTTEATQQQQQQQCVFTLLSGTANELTDKQGGKMNVGNSLSALK